MKLTVVIPTHNRKRILEKVLGAFFRQRQPIPSFTILVVDDGSEDGTSDLVAQLAASAPVPVMYYYQENRGLAAARNSGIRNVTGEVLLFCDDDIVPAENLVAEHLRMHQEHPEPNVAVLGCTVWSPELRVTPFMRWYGESGALLDLKGIERKIDLDVLHFYGGHMSLKPEFMKAHGMYDEDFTTYGWEDFELGYRLFQRGLRLLYNPCALGYHYQTMTFADACRRAQMVEAGRRAIAQREAGRYLAELKQRRNSRFAWRMARSALSMVVPLLSPLKLVLDSGFQLPDSVYRSFYWYYGTRVAERAALPATPDA
jgi:glycosyltransferase involved in cell wall biosynthesis